MQLLHAELVLRSVCGLDWLDEGKSLLFVTGLGSLLGFGW
jgi:hypothetical protein